ncbi:M15 family metallopeptidase [Sphingomonas panaciterrae]|uniref:M15 family metallopeptidase n=1 Tax=Sphingomonas panaciterrae TaxID=1462999 RepID=UPI002FF18FCF
MADDSVFPLVLAIREDGSIDTAMSGFEQSILAGTGRAAQGFQSLTRQVQTFKSETARKIADPLGIDAALKSLNASPFQKLVDAQLSAQNALAAQQARASAERVAQIQREFDAAMSAIRQEQAARTAAWAQADREAQALVSLQQQRIAAAVQSVAAPQQLVGMSLDPRGSAAAAAAARAFATEQEALARAAERVAAATDKATIADRNYAIAAREAANAALLEAQRLEDNAATHTRVADAVAQSGVKLGQSSDFATSSARNQRFAYVQLGQQLQDSIIQAQLGTSALIILTQQGSQAAYAFTEFGGKVGAAARFLAGWQGAVLLGALTLTGMLIPALFKESEADEMAAKAKEAHRKAVLDLAKAQGDAITTMERKQALDTAQIKIDLDAAIATRQRTQALLEQARAEEQLNNSAGAASIAGEAISEVQRQSRNRVTELERQLAENNTKLTALQSGYNAGLARLIGQRVDAMRDPRSGIDLIYRQQRSALENDPALQKNGALLAAKLDALADARDREIQAVNDAEAAQKKLTNKVNEIGRTITLSEAKGIVAGIGGTVTSGLRSRDHQAQLYARYQAGTGPLAARPGHSNHELGQALDIAKSEGMTIGKIRDAFRARGVQVTELLDEGRHFHVAWKASATASKEANAAAREAAKAEREAAQAQRELEQSLDAITTRFDPATAAARDYAETLTEINKLAGAGMISNGTAFDLQMRAGRADSDRKGAEFNQSFRDIFGPDVDTIIQDWERGLSAGAVAASEELKIGTRQAAEELRFAVSGIADLLGVRINGPFRNLLQPGGIQGQADDIADALSRSLRGAGINLSERSEARLASVMAGAGYGQIGASIYSGVSGRPGNGTLGAIGGILGNEGGKALGSTIATAVGGSLGKMLGSAAGPLGAIAGGILGNVVGGLFRTVKYGTSNVTQSGSSIAGNSSSARGAAGNLGDSVAQGVQRIVDQFGGTLGNYNVSIGTFDGKYRVSTTGFKGSLDSKKARGQGLVDFGTDGAEAAIRFAIADAIKDGAVQGLRAGTQRLIQLGNDVEVQLQKALQFESVFTQLRQMKDPIGAAAEAIEKEFANLRKIFDEAGATSEERAQLEELYAIKRTEAIKQAQESAIGQLKDLLDDLKQGDNGLSLRTREQNILQSFTPLMEAIQRGEKVDQGQFTDAARNYLDIQRQLYGSTNPYFEALAKVTELTNKAIQNSGAGANVASLLSGDKQGALAAAAAAGGSIPTGSTFDISGMVNAVSSQTDTLAGAIAATNSRLDLISKQLAQNGTPMVLQIGDSGNGLARVNALRNA